MIHWSDNGQEKEINFISMSKYIQSNKIYSIKQKNNFLDKE